MGRGFFHIIHFRRHSTRQHTGQDLGYGCSSSGSRSQAYVLGRSANEQIKRLNIGVQSDLQALQARYLDPDCFSNNSPKLQYPDPNQGDPKQHELSPDEGPSHAAAKSSFIHQPSHSSRHHGHLGHHEAVATVNTDRTETVRRRPSSGNRTVVRCAG